MIIFSEIKKIVLFPALWGFMALLLVFNTMLVFGGDFSNEIDYINAVTTVAGDEYGADYLERIEAIIPPDENSDGMADYLHRTMLGDAQSYSGGLQKSYFTEEYDGFTKAEWIKDNSLNKSLLSALKNKYEKVKNTIAQKNASGETDSVVFASRTSQIFGYASGTMGRILLAESVVVAVLIILFSVSYEHISNTDLLLYSTKEGRKKLAQSKITAALIIAAASFTMIFGYGYGLFFSLNDFSLIWDKPISSVDNFVELISGRFPVVAWGKLTFGGYFILSILLSFVMMLVFFAFAAALGLIFKDSYLAFGAIAFGAFVNIILIFMPPFSLAVNFLVYLLPTGILFSMPAWFQYGGTATLFAYQEIRCTILWLIVSVLMLAASMRYFVKRDIK